MTNLDRYSKVFCDTFEIELSELINLKYQDIAAWDSVGHMALIAALEEMFDLMMETDDIIDFSSYEKGLSILSDKYHVKF